MKTVINVHDFKTHYSKYLARVKRGETLIIGERGNPVARLVPETPVLQEPRKLGALKGKIWIADDFDEPMTELMERIENRPL